MVTRGAEGTSWSGQLGLMKTGLEPTLCRRQFHQQHAIGLLKSRVSDGMQKSLLQYKWYRSSTRQACPSKAKPSSVSDLASPYLIYGQY